MRNAHNRKRGKMSVIYDLVLFDAHGAGDSGAVANNGRQEKDLSKELNDLIENYLKHNYNTGTIKRVTEGYLSYNVSSRLGICNHFNAGGGTGSEVLTPAGETTSPLNNDFRAGFLNILTKSGRYKNRGLKPAQLYAYNHGADVYNEICFVDSPNNTDLKIWDKIKNDVARDFGDYIANFLKWKRKTAQNKPPTPPPKPTTPNKPPAVKRPYNGAYDSRRDEKATATFKKVSSINTHPIAGTPTGINYGVGQSVVYDEVICNDGYIWLGYTRTSGGRGFVASGTYKKQGNKLVDVSNWCDFK